MESGREGRSTGSFAQQGGQLVAVHCAALSSSLLGANGSAMRGRVHRRDDARKGRFEMADGGVVSWTKFR
jgi:transcriptional regulator with GAF, ATPase, and Fis domain